MSLLLNSPTPLKKKTTMKRIILLLAVSLLGSNSLKAQDSLWMHVTAQRAIRMPIEGLDSITFCSTSTSDDAIFTSAEELAHLSGKIEGFTQSVGDITASAYGTADMTAGKCYITKNEGAVGTPVETNYRRGREAHRHGASPDLRLPHS